ncbi:MAG TPA: hypothetical protein PLV85_21320, partial [Polyangiaceae bacterium]|nr:hypothetical protein [Polyangiaceae bacterium]
MRATKPNPDVAILLLLTPGAYHDADRDAECGTLSDDNRCFLPRSHYACVSNHFLSWGGTS